MEINNQFQNIKLFLNNIQSQFVNIENQLKNIGFFSISSQIKYLGIQTLYAGLQMLSTGIEIPNNIYTTDMNDINLQVQLKNIIIQLQNVELKFSNLNLHNNSFINGAMGINMPNMGFFPNNLNFNFNKESNKDKICKKMNILFASTTGRKKNMIFEYGTTINDVLKKFFIEIGKPEFINNIEGINFICNSNGLSLLKFGDETKIEDYFLIDKSNNYITVSYSDHCNFNW